MAITVPPSGYGTKTTTGSEDTLFDTTTAGTYTLSVDLKNLAGGDTVVIKAYVAWAAAGARSHMVIGGTGATFSGAQSAPNILQKTFAVVAPYGVKFTITRSAGSDRAYDWRVDQIGTVAVLQSGTQATTNAEVTIGAAVASGAVIVLLADVGAQGAGASVTFRAKEKVLVAGTLQEVYQFVTTAGAVTDDGSQHLQSVPVDAAYSGSFTMIRAGGSDYNVPYIIAELAA